jgi:hypothetical protein
MTISWENRDMRGSVLEWRVEDKKEGPAPSAQPVQVWCLVGSAVIPRVWIC